MFTPICMAEEYWANSQFSIARHYGGVKIGQHQYTIVGKTGQDVFELSRIAEAEGRDKAIPPGEPADLCRNDFIKYYRALGRDAFLKVLEDHPRTPATELMAIYKKLCPPKPYKPKSAKRKA